MTTPFRLSATEYLDPETGEVYEIPEGEGDVTAWAAREHFECSMQIKEYEARKRFMGSLIAAGQPADTIPKAAYGDVIAAHRSRTNKHIDGSVFADLVFERYSGAFVDATGPDGESAHGEVLEIIAAAKTFDRDKLPEAAKALLDDATTEEAGASWVQTSRVRKPAPRTRKAAPEELEAVEA